MRILEAVRNNRPSLHTLQIGLNIVLNEKKVKIKGKNYHNTIYVIKNTFQISITHFTTQHHGFLQERNRNKRGKKRSDKRERPCENK